MEVDEEINIQTNIFVPKKASKRTAATAAFVSNDNEDVAMHKGIEGRAKQLASCPKRSKTKRESATSDIRKIPVPSNRYSPLKDNWMKIFSPIVEHLQLEIRFNLKTRNVEIRMSKNTPDISNLQKAADFVLAFIYGFDIDDALALLRLDDLFIETFEVKDVKTLKGEHHCRAVGRLAGQGGRTKFTIENVTKTRIVLADTKIHILGSYQNIQLARKAICNLILGSPPAKVYGQLRSIASKISQRI